MLSSEEISLLCKGLSFCPTPDHHLSELNDDLYRLSRSLRLKYHFRDKSYVDPSIVKLPSTFTPAPYVNAELEQMVDKLKHLNVVVDKRPRDNIKELRPALTSLKSKTTAPTLNEGDVTVIMLL